METEKPVKTSSFISKLMIFIIILATIFTVYLTIKLVITGFTFR